MTQTSVAEIRRPAYIVAKIADRDPVRIAEARALAHVSAIDSAFSWAELEHALDPLLEWLDACAPKLCVPRFLFVGPHTPASFFDDQASLVLMASDGTRLPVFWDPAYLDAVAAQIERLFAALAPYAERIAYVRVGALGLTTEPSFYGDYTPQFQAQIEAGLLRSEWAIPFRGRQPLLTWAGPFGVAARGVLDVLAAMASPQLPACVTVRIPQVGGASDDFLLGHNHHASMQDAGHLFLGTTNASPDASALLSVRTALNLWGKDGETVGFVDADDLGADVDEQRCWDLVRAALGDPPAVPIRSFARFLTVGPSLYRYAAPLNWALGRMRRI